MSFAAESLDSQQRHAISEFLSNIQGVEKLPRSAFCENSKIGPLSLAGQTWNGWGVTPANSRFQTAKDAGLTAEEIPRLKLKWAFGFPGSSTARSQPAVVGDRVFVNNHQSLYSLDAKTGCIHWIFEIRTKITTPAISIGQIGGQPLAFVGDDEGTVYSVNASTGKLVWKLRVDDSPTARLTGSPKLLGDRLYVPVSSKDADLAESLDYECCKFRGSLVALDAPTGKILWKSYTIPEQAMQTRKNGRGTWFWGPAGAAIWSSPTLDLKLNRVYVGTGNSYSSPPSKGANAIIAFSMDSGKVEWSRQFTSNDVWNYSCVQKQYDRDLASCPDKDAPDDDFAASPILVELKGGQRVLLGPQKSKLVAMDPDREGAHLWQHEFKEKGRTRWGPATNGKTVYVPTYRENSKTSPQDPLAYGDLFAFDVLGGKQLWHTPAPACSGGKPCSQGQNAAVTAIDGAVFSGAVDGHMRAYSALTGKLIWDYDAAHPFKTVNEISANGGSFGAAGPTVAGGILFATSGQNIGGAPLAGNVLLAFSVDGK